MTQKKPHWTAECARVKEERDALKRLLNEVYIMAGMYYADMQQIRFKIKQSGVIKE